MEEDVLILHDKLYARVNQKEKGLVDQLLVEKINTAMGGIIQ